MVRGTSENINIICMSQYLGQICCMVDSKIHSYQVLNRMGTYERLNVCCDVHFEGHIGQAISIRNMETMADVEHVTTKVTTIATLDN